MSFITTVDKPIMDKGEGCTTDDKEEEGTERSRVHPLKDDYDVSSCLKEGKNALHTFRDRERGRNMSQAHRDEINNRSQRNSSNCNPIIRVDSGPSIAGVERTLSLLTVFTNAYQLLCTFRCREVSHIHCLGHRCLFSLASTPMLL